MENLYNLNIIRRFSQKEQIETLRTPEKLKQILEDYLNRYLENDKEKGIVGSNILLKETLDHLVLCNIINSPNSINSIEAKNYISFLEKICSEDSLEYSTNVIFQSQNSISERFSLLHGSQNKNDEKLGNICAHIEKGELISEEELIFFSKWLIGSINHSKDKKYIDIFLKYILNIYYKNAEQKISLPVLQAIASCSRVLYCDLFLSDESEELKKHFLSRGTVMSKFSIKYGTLSKAGYNWWVGTFLSPKKYENVSIIPNSKQKHSRPDFNLETTDIGAFIFVLGHEYTHCIQNLKRTSEEYSFRGIVSIIDYILKKECSYSYDANHDAFSSEIDADMVGWNFCDAFLEKYSNKLYSKYYEEQGKSIFVRHKNSVMTRYNFSKIDDKYLYGITILLAKVQENPSQILNEYPMLKNLFDEKGNPNITSIITLNNLDEFQLLFLKYLIVYYRDNGSIKSLIEKTIMENKSNVNVYSKIIGNLSRIYKNNVLILNLIEKTMSNDDYNTVSSLGNVSEITSRFETENKIIEELIMSIINKNNKYDYLNNMFITPNGKLR